MSVRTQVTRLTDDVRTRAVVVPYVLSRAVVLFSLVLTRHVLRAGSARRLPIQARMGLLGWDAAWYRDIAQGAYGHVAKVGLRFFLLFPLLVPAVVEAYQARDVARQKLVALGAAVVAPVVGAGAYLVWAKHRSSDFLYPLSVQQASTSSSPRTRSSRSWSARRLATSTRSSYSLSTAPLVLAAADLTGGGTRERVVLVALGATLVACSVLAFSGVLVP